MGLDTGAVVVGSISIITLVITKLKCYAKRNGTCNYGCGFMDKPIINDDDDMEVKIEKLGSVDVMYVKSKHHQYIESESEEEEEEEEEEE